MQNKLCVSCEKVLLTGCNGVCPFLAVSIIVALFLQGLELWSYFVFQCSALKQIKDADLYKTIKGIQSAVNELSIALHTINTGNGTAGKLLADPAIYNQLQNTIKSVNTLVD